MNFGKFIENGSCGYVLKPDYMIRDDVSEPKNNSVRITVNVISANHLPKPGGAQKGLIRISYSLISTTNVITIDTNKKESLRLS